jgi:carboxyl-terminal processing protease
LRSRTPTAFLVTLSILVSGLVAGTSSTLEAYDAGGSSYEGLDVFAKTLGHIQAHYFEERTTPILVDAAINGMVDSLDNHSSFFTPEEYARLLADAEGKYFGVGIEVAPAENGGLLILEILEAGPARNSGLLTGDRIVTVDGNDITKTPYQEVVARIRGPRGEVVEFGILRVGVETQLEFRIVRDQVLTPSVTQDWAEPGIGYIRINQFRHNSSIELANALTELEESRLDGLVLDVRHNPGGLLQEAISAVDLFVSEGTIVSIKTRKKQSKEVHRAQPETTVTQVPMVVLIDSASASAAEIVAGALQDHGRAVLIGVQSFGKGSVQSIFEYPDQSALKLTTAQYLLPSGRSLEETGGIQPDHTVALDKPVSEAADTLLQQLKSVSLNTNDRAVLERILEQLASSENRARRPRFRGAFEDRVEEDLQLQAAIRVVKEHATQ